MRIMLISVIENRSLDWSLIVNIVRNCSGLDSVVSLAVDWILLIIAIRWTVCCVFSLVLNCYFSSFWFLRQVKIEAVWER